MTLSRTQVDAELAARELPPVPDPLPRAVIDSHTHLDTTEEYSGVGPELLLDAARYAGVGALVEIGCDVASSRYAVDVAERYPTVAAAVALHPNDAAAAGDEWETQFAVIDELARRGGRVRAVGETGLDYYRTKDPDAQDLQRRAFAAHIELAREVGLTLAIHDREAHEDIVAVLDRTGWPERVIFHCFSADAAYARRVLHHDVWLSFPGTVTFKANGYLRDALAATPLDRILVETDAPFLTPVPLRGQKNASYLIPWTARFIAEQRDEPLEKICDVLWHNAAAAYGGEWCAREEVPR